MRRPPVADELRIGQREDVARLSPDERVRLALELGRESVALAAEASALSVSEVCRARERRQQARRRPSACLEALLA